MYIYIKLYICIYVHVCTCIHAHTRAGTHTDTYIHMYTYTYKHIKTPRDTHIHMLTYIDTHTYTCIHAYIQARKHPSWHMFNSSRVQQTYHASFSCGCHSLFTSADVYSPTQNNMRVDFFCTHIYLRTHTYIRIRVDISTYNFLIAFDLVLLSQIHTHTHTHTAVNIWNTTWCFLHTKLVHCVMIRDLQKKNGSVRFWESLLDLPSKKLRTSLFIS